jgi:hypothetical protein
MVKITWKYNKTEVYVNGHYCGYIDCFGNNNAWYGNVYFRENDQPTMKHFGVVYDKQQLINAVEQFINENANVIISECKRIELLNNE